MAASWVIMLLRVPGIPVAVDQDPRRKRPQTGIVRLVSVIMGIAGPFDLRVIGIVRSCFILTRAVTTDRPSPSKR